MMKFDAFIKSRKTPFSVIPAKAGIQEQQVLLDPGFRRGDGFDDLLGVHQTSSFEIPCSTFDIHLVLLWEPRWAAPCRVEHRADRQVS